MDSDRGEQTQSVGTVHYMAPEISTGNYNRQVDIYAAGVVLYEMLCGKTPFDGDSAGEILMKHLTSMPDLSKVPSGLVPILDQALRKNPANRFQTIAEMARKVHSGGRGLYSDPGHPTALSATQQENKERGTRNDKLEPPPLSPLPASLAALAGSLLYAALLAGLGAMAWSTVFTSSDLPALLRIFVPTAVCAWIVLLLGRVWNEPMVDSGKRRLVQLLLGALLGLIVMWMDGYRFEDGLRPFESPEVENRPRAFGSFYPDNRTLPVLFCYVGFYGLMFGVLRWWRLSERSRPEMFSLQGVVATMLLAFVLLFLLPGTVERQAGFAVLVLASGIVQLASPYSKAVVVRKKRYRLQGV
jgi:eukaryotic-like serine/threonine-protein kinase